MNSDRPLRGTMSVISPDKGTSSRSENRPAFLRIRNPRVMPPSLWRRGTEMGIVSMDNKSLFTTQHSSQRSRPSPIAESILLVSCPWLPMVHTKGQPSFTTLHPPLDINHVIIGSTSRHHPLQDFGTNQVRINSFCSQEPRLSQRQNIGWQT